MADAVSVAADMNADLVEAVRALAPRPQWNGRQTKWDDISKIGKGFPDFTR